MEARSVLSRSRRAASAIICALWSSRLGSVPPTACGQKNCNWRSAAAWKVRAWTLPTPRSRSRLRISAAARAVKVTARSRCGLYTPECTP